MYGNKLEWIDASKISRTIWVNNLSNNIFIEIFITIDRICMMKLFSIYVYLNMHFLLCLNIFRIIYLHIHVYIHIVYNKTIQNSLEP